MKFGLPATPGASPGSNLSVRLEQTTLAARSEGPKYDASYLEDLKAYTNSSRPVQLTSNTDEQNKDDDSEMMLDASEMEGALIESVEELPLVSSRMNADTMIPSESSIKAAREKRDRLRKTGAPEGAEEEFISLSVAKRDEFAQGPHPSSRLMREDDDLGEGDDDDAEYTGAQERIALSKKGRKNAEKERKKGIVELIEEADEQDEETMEWELAQVKRAVPAEYEAEKSQKQQPRSYKPSPIPTPSSIPTLDSAISRISHTLTNFTASHTQSTDAIAALTDEQMKFDVEEAELRRQVEHAEEKRAWFQTFRDRVETVAEFLDEKFPALEKLEAEHISLLSERAEMVNKRRIDDDEDDLVLLYGVPADMQDSGGQVDELGRALPSTTGADSAVRRERRQERIRRHAAGSLDGAAVTEQGYATDSRLSHSDAADFEQAMATLRNKVQAEIFQDVKAKAFKDPKHGIAIWFKEWKEKWPDIYHSAFGGMGLVQAWEFWARVELVGWIPLDVPPRLEEFKWYTQLYEYTHTSSMEDDDQAETIRPEDDLPVNMCSTMLVPRLNALISGGAFDTYSAVQIPWLIDMAEQIEASLGTENIRFSSFLTTVAREFKKSGTSLTERHQRFTDSQNAIPQFNPEVIMARQRFMKRVMKLITNILKWRRYTKERDGIGATVTSLAELIFSVARGGWEVGGEEIVKELGRILPADLKPASIQNAL